METGDQELVPPDELVYVVGGGDFKKVGEEFLHYFKNIGMLQPNDRVLDIGCGCGRMAVPLTRYLSKNGSYEGFDIYDPGVKWCQDNITPRYPNFRFQLAEVYNHLYNPTGKYKVSEYKFPYDDHDFDFVFLTSVFTHLLPDGLENYLAEISRVMKMNGRCLITFFLINDESLRLINSGRSLLKFTYDYGVYRVHDANIPEWAVAYDEQFIRNLMGKYKLKIVEPIHYGSWCEREHFLSLQDLMIVKHDL